MMYITYITLTDRSSEKPMDFTKARFHTNIGGNNTY